jgi:hypothetical protein
MVKFMYRPILSRHAFSAALNLAVIFVVVSAAPSRADEVWRFDTVGKLGGHEVTVVGAPKVVEENGVKAIRFDGAHDGLFVPDIPIAGAKAFTIEVLLYPVEGGPEAQRFFHLQDTEERRAMIETRLDGKGGWWLDTFIRSGAEPNGKAVTLIDPHHVHPTNHWYWVALRCADGHMAHFIDGRKELEGDIPFSQFGNGRISVGVRQNLVYWFKGSIREIRFHRDAVPDDKLQRVN